jgi:hypothetical protein
MPVFFKVLQYYQQYYDKKKLLAPLNKTPVLVIPYQSFISGCSANIYVSNGVVNNSGCKNENIDEWLV